MEHGHISIADEKNSPKSADLGVISKQPLKKGKFFMWFELA
jgi:hypothetical protein